MLVRTLFALAIAVGLALPVAARDDDDDKQAAPETAEAPSRVIAPTADELARFQLTETPRDFSRPAAGVGFRASGTTMFIASAADVLTTEWGLSRGLSEGNPLVQRRSVRIATHIAGPLAVYWATERLHRDGRGKLALLLRISIMAAYSYASIHNTRMIASAPGSPF